MLIVVHAPNHLLSAVGWLLLRPAWIDVWQPHVIDGTRTLFWIPPALLAAGLTLRGAAARDDARGALTRRDLLLACSIAVAACAIRAAVLLTEPWIKPDYDEGVYLGGAWLLRDGALPYRDFVFPHLPGGLLLLQPAAALIRLWQDNSTALLVGRLTTALSDGVAAGLIVLAARQLVAWPGALLAGLVYASDALTVEYSRQIWLEPLQAPWLVGGAILLLVTLNGRRLGGAAGFALALGVTVKLSGAVVPLAAISTLALTRRWRDLRDLLIGGAIGALLVCGWAVLAAGDEIARQTLLLQLQRPFRSYGRRWEFLLGDRWTAFTAMSALLGMLLVTARAWRQRVAGGWTFLALWTAFTYLLFAQAADFYEHYYTGLAAPLALWAGALPGLFERNRRWIIGGSLVLLLAPLWWGQARQWRNVDRAPAERVEVDVLLTQPPGTTLTFVPLLNVLSGRPIIQAPAGPYLLDLFLGKPYLDSSLNRRWSDAASTLARAGERADYILANRVDADAVPSLSHSFIWQTASPTRETLLFTRVDRPEDVLRIGDTIEVLRRFPGQVIEDTGGRWLVQPLHWRAAQTPPDDLALAIHVVDETGARVAQLDVPVNGGVAWEPDLVTTLEYRVPLPQDLPPRRYQVQAQIYSWADGSVKHLRPVTDGAPINMLELPPVEIAP